jgi:hypothetical protein
VVDKKSMSNAADSPASPSSPAAVTATMDSSHRRTNALGALPWVNAVSYLVNVVVTYGLGVVKTLVMRI